MFQNCIFFHWNKFSSGAFFAFWRQKLLRQNSLKKGIVMRKKIAFIICVNDEVYFSECLFYIGRLHVPEGYEIEVYPLRGAKSIYEAYQQAMEQSDAEIGRAHV